MSDCNNPKTPTYNKLKPIPRNLGCTGGGGNIILPPFDGGGGGKSAEVLAGIDIAVDDLSDTLIDRFMVHSAPYTDVAVALALDLLAVGDLKSQPVLKGTIIDRVEASWNYNAFSDPLILTQSLNNSFGAIDPILGATERDAVYSNVAVTNNNSVTITGADDRTNDSDTKNIVFGNYLAIGVTTPSMLFQDPLTIQILFDALNDKSITTTQQNKSFNAFGTSSPPEYMVIAYPKHYAESTFTKGAFTGGYIRMIRTLRNGIPTWVTSLQGGEQEIDVDIDNGNGFVEAYWFYQSENPARTGELSTIITKT